MSNERKPLQEGYQPQGSGNYGYQPSGGTLKKGYQPTASSPSPGKNPPSGGSGAQSTPQGKQ